MRKFVLPPAAAAALAIAAIATWGPGFAGPRAAPDHRPPPASSNHRASEAIGSATSGSMVIAVPRYRAEDCGGDYVCVAEGPWEPVAGEPPTEVFPLTSDGF